MFYSIYFLYTCNWHGTSCIYQHVFYYYKFFNFLRPRKKKRRNWWQRKESGRAAGYQSCWTRQWRQEHVSTSACGGRHLGNSAQDAPSSFGRQMRSILRSERSLMSCDSGERRKYQHFCVVVVRHLGDSASNVCSFATEDFCRIQRGMNYLQRTRPSCGSRVIRLFFVHPLPPPPVRKVSFLLLSQCSCVSPVELFDGRGGGKRWSRSRLIRLRESLVLYKSFNTVWCNSSQQMSCEQRR